MLLATAVRWQADELCVGALPSRLLPFFCRVRQPLLQLGSGFRSNETPPKVSGQRLRNLSAELQVQMLMPNFGNKDSSCRSPSAAAVLHSKPSE